MKHFLNIPLMILSFFTAFSMTARAQRSDAEFRKMADKYAGDFPTVTPAELHTELQHDKVVILDTREKEEYDVSHLPGAIWYGYKDRQEDKLAAIPKGATIVVYCSVGYRSGKIGEKLRKEGYVNVRNLYGGIFNWFNQGFRVVNNDGRDTKKIHAYNEKWAQWITRGTKVY